MSSMQIDVLWDAVSGLAAAGALLVSLLVWWTQRRRDQQHADIQARLASIEEARRGDEVERHKEARERALIADVRIVEFRLERSGSSGESDRVSITIENRGPAAATSVDIALPETEERAPSSHLGEVVERVDEHVSYFQVPWSGRTEPLEALGPGERVTLPFWLRYRAFGNEKIRLTWEDGRGRQITRSLVPFDSNPAYRY